MRRHLVTAAAVLLLVAGCTSGDTKEEVGSKGTGSDTGGTSTTLDPEEVAQTPGVADNSVKIGVTYVDETALRAAGINFKTGDYKGSYEVLVDKINAEGGINGRKIELVFAPINPVGTAPADAACLQLAEDEKVFAMVGFFLNDAVLCPVETHDIAVVGGTQTPERLERAKAPWFTTDAGSELPKQIVRAFAEHGDLEGKIAVFAAAGDEEVMDEVLSVLDEEGVKPVETGVLTAEQGDTTAAKSEVQVISQRFKSKGADSVLLVGPNAFQWYNAMQDNPYRPRLLITDAAGVTAFTSNAATTDTSLLKGSIVGGTYGPETRNYDEPKMQKCIGALEKAGIEVPRPDPSDPNEKRYVGPFDACTHVALLQALLEAAGKDLNYATFRNGGYTLGEVAIPGDPSSHTYGPPPATDGSPKAYLSQWDPATKTFVASD